MPIAISAPSFLRAALSAMILSLLAMAPAAAQTVGGYTNMTFDPGHGTQIEYMSTSGKTYLWYPGNTRILKGQWRAEGSNLCFDYGSNSYNPVTGTRGGWECTPLRSYQRSLVDRAEGDVFGLAGRRQVPFRLNQAKTTLGQISARLTSSAAPTGIPAPNGGTLSCESIIANAEQSRADMVIAANVYFHGEFMGEPCVDVDYVRAFDLAERSGTGFQSYLRVLRERAANGLPTAIAALRRLGY